MWENSKLINKFINFINELKTQKMPSCKTKSGAICVFSGNTVNAKMSF